MGVRGKFDWEAYAAVMAGAFGLALGVLLFFAVTLGVQPMVQRLHASLPASYVLLSIGFAVGAFALLRVRMPVIVRGLLIGMSISLLGLFAMCDVFSVPTLFDSASKGAH